MLRQSIIQVTGYTNEKSSIDCDEGNERKHRELSHITHQQNSTDNNIKQFPRIFNMVFSNQCGTDPASKQPSCGCCGKQFPPLPSHV